MSLIKNIILLTILVTANFNTQGNEELQEKISDQVTIENGQKDIAQKTTEEMAEVEKTIAEKTAEEKKVEQVQKGDVEIEKKGTQEAAQPEKAADEKEKEAEQKEVVEKEAIKEEEKKAKEKKETKEGAQPEKTADEKEKEAEQKEVVEKETVKEEEKKTKEEIAQEVAQPEKTADEKEKEAEQKKVVEKEVVEEIGIDTFDIDEPQGNWLFKRMWWEHAEERYEKIRELVQKIWDSRMSFFIKRTELDKTIFDPFYISIGLGQGELHEILSELVNRIEQEQQEEGVLSQSERSLLSRLKAEQETLEQTKLDVESINQLDQDIDQALNRLMEQINRVRSYEREAWEHFKEIARVLNDKKARALFFKIDTALRNIKSINDYLQGDFTQHFNQLLQKINTQVGKVVNEVQGLKEKGIDFKKQLETIEEEQPLLEEELEEEKEKREEIAAAGWGTRLWDNIVATIRWPYEKLVGTQESKPSE